MTAAPLPFHRRASDALANAGLQEALDISTGRMTAARRLAFGALADGDAIRDHAREIRAHTITHLADYLDRFVASARAAGATVTFAPDAAAARQYVVDLARERNVRHIVKSKSMVTEEIELNASLEAAGLDVVETDLGEYVVQLDHDHPSHIIAPIIHKTRRDVAETFQRELHATDEEVADVPQMTAFARRRLRSAFLSADMGISGVNFGVAETGSVCLCTNEGNGRLTTTLPRIHVAMMGIERIVPTTQDLAVVLQVLARSATGQALTVYTNLVTGARRADDLDGPSEVHIVLVDNGRSQMLQTDLEEILYCIRCGACLNACPVYQEIGGHAYGSVYPGPVGSVLTPGAFGRDVWADLPQASSLCGACREVCPVRIDIPRMLLSLRAERVAAGDAPVWLRGGLRGFRAVATRPWLFRLAGRVGRVVLGLLARNGRIERLPGPLAGWTAHRTFPTLARDTFTSRWRKVGR